MGGHGLDRETLILATLVILTGIALGLRAPVSGVGAASPQYMLSVPGRR